MNYSLLEKIRARFYLAFRNMSGKFQIDRLSRFSTVARQMFTTKRPFLSETPLTMKTATSNSL